MTGIAHIDSLFTAILSQSRAIEGRFYIGYRYGLQEVNYEQLGEVISHFKFTKKYPLVMMPPPTSQTQVGGGKSDGWDEYRIILFFVKQSLVEDIDNDTKTSQHRVVHDWHDMKRCAINFLRALREVPPKLSRLPSHKILIVPFSSIGNDRLSGVSVHFDYEVWLGCTVEDYDEYPTEINLEDDTHPEHKL